MQCYRINTLCLPFPGNFSVWCLFLHILIELLPVLLLSCSQKVHALSKHIVRSRGDVRHDILWLRVFLHNVPKLSQNSILYRWPLHRSFCMPSHTVSALTVCVYAIVYMRVRFYTLPVPTMWVGYQWWLKDKSVSTVTDTVLHWNLGYEIANFMICWCLSFDCV